SVGAAALLAAGFLVAVLLVAVPTGPLACIVGDVPAGPLELDGGGGEQLLHFRPAGGAGGEGRIGELADQLEPPALRALVLVQRHASVSSEATTLANQCYALRAKPLAPHWGLTAAARLRPQTPWCY